MKARLLLVAVVALAIGFLAGRWTISPQPRYTVELMGQGGLVALKYDRVTGKSWTMRVSDTTWKEVKAGQEAAGVNPSNPYEDLSRFGTPVNGSPE